MQIKLGLIWPGCAQGRYTVKAKGCILAILRWGNAQGPLPDWGPFAYVPLDPAGNGIFYFPGKRAIPQVADRVCVRCLTQDFSDAEEFSQLIPPALLPPPLPGETPQRFSVLTDLHLSAQPGRVIRALLSAHSDQILLLGDCTNDGRPEQFQAFLSRIESAAFGKTVLPVPGNHDVPAPTHPGHESGIRSYSMFQEALLRKAEDLGVPILRDPGSLAYATSIGNLDVIGLQCVETDRKFLFPQGAQLDWLEAHLAACSNAAWHVILCHAPLLQHNPNRRDGTPYLDRNKRLQEIVDRTGNVLFLSGHTHVSPNCLTGNADADGPRRNVYLDCGSVVATDTEGEKGLMSPDWKDGCISELAVFSDEIEITMRSLSGGKKFPRGHYRFRKTDTAVHAFPQKK